ncbi:unnamed protein product, partial [Staurois parvus]
MPLPLGVLPVAVRVLQGLMELAVPQHLEGHNLETPASKLYSCIVRFKVVVEAGGFLPSCILCRKLKNLLHADPPLPCIYM